MGLWRRLPTLFVHRIERGFYLLGALVARRPWTTIVACAAVATIAAVLVAATGLTRETSPLRLWVPPSSRFAEDTRWLASRYGRVVRQQHALIVGEDALKPETLASVAELHEAVRRIENPSYEDVCLKVPVVAGLRTRRAAQTDPFKDDFFRTEDRTVRPFDPSVDVDSRFYCQVLGNLPLECLYSGALELWDFDPKIIRELRTEDIISKIASTKSSPITGHPIDYVATLGGVRYDSSGNLESARAILFTWFVLVDFSTDERIGNEAGTEEWASKIALDWEDSFLEVVQNSSAKIYFEAGRSFGDLSGETMFRDVDKLVIGIALMFVYIQLILSKFDWVLVKFTLGSVGLLCVALALIVSYSLCSLLRVPYGPVHNSLPFLLMGLGIDDMFVMKACWESLTESENKLSLPERIGIMLQHAGVSIVITSFTDIVAFMVGAITVLPSLQSFCIYAAVGVFFIFVFSVTFYVAVFVLDLKRIESKRNGVLVCIKHPNYVPRVHTRSVSEYILHNLYSKIILTKPIKLVILLVTIIMAGFSLESALKLEQKFDPTWFIPENSYYSKYLQMRQKYFPEMGHEGLILIGALNYSEELPKIYDLINNLSNETDIIQYVDPWTVPFRSYILNNFDVDVESSTLSDSEWSTYISKFLFSPSGSKYQFNFRFSGNLSCGKPAPAVIVSSVDFRFRVFDDPKIYLPAKHRLQNIVDVANFTTGDRFATIWAKIFANWETDEVIKAEVERNLELALLCVMICTLFLIANIQMCFWIFLCVFLTLVNVCGWMQRLGLTIDIVSCVGLELGIGFCVDYAAHIGHTFLTVHGARNNRALDTVTSMGAAVLYGGGSTFLALSVLSVSETYIFKTFFKIFFLVIVFGLYNGLLFLPVILSLIGPQPYEKLNRQSQNDNKAEENDVQLKNIVQSNTEVMIVE